MPRTEITRLSEKASQDRARLDALLDESRVASVGLVADGHPVVIPTGVARDGDMVLVHGSTGSRWMRSLASGADACLTVTALDGLVVARSAFESSMHYRSAVIFGRFTALDTGPEKARALDVLTESLLPGRLAEVRRPTSKELAATLVLAMPIEEWSLKVSDGWPEDPPEDVAGDAWAGVVPLREVAGQPRSAPDLRPGIAVPASVTLHRHQPPGTVERASRGTGAVGLRIREAGEADWPAIWPFFAGIVQEGETYAYPPDLDVETGRRLWLLDPPGRTVVAVDERGRTLGTATMQANRPGAGSHVATASFMVDPSAAGRGVGRALGEHVIDWATERGFRSIQFNAVVETNTRAVGLWLSLGFEIVGTVPEAFRRPTGEYVGLHVMYRPLPGTSSAGDKHAAEVQTGR